MVKKKVQKDEDGEFKETFGYSVCGVFKQTLVDMSKPELTATHNILKSSESTVHIKDKPTAQIGAVTKKKESVYDRLYSQRPKATTITRLKVYKLEQRWNT